ncbi:hypothetical protein SLEP1_g4433 [Rubroshorea leprosula]|uniref:Reverse transcriptase Ty1/copia-type domain-containing protein n=1 Tax=Rubroshorea leprosula TaxID=152421 RepID=A0AAV5HUN3_9ROSI|nr:hypothetical protein SLEP1_g4433 [Rubroshorea leprosula]
MVTRAKSGKHTGHIQTVFPKFTHVMTSNTSSLIDADVDIREPKTVRKALQLPHWVTEMEEELEALHKNNTWTLVFAPSPQTNIVGSKWVFKTKLNSDGSVDRFKARSLDVKNAFLHGNLKEEVYMHQPPSFEDPIHLDYVCKLIKSIYGLKQAPRAWFDTFTFQFLKMGFSYNRANSSLFILHNGQDTILLLLYVDDIVLTASSLTLLQEVINNLSSKFALKDLGSLSYFLAATIATPLAVKDITTRDNDPVDTQEYRKIDIGVSLPHPPQHFSDNISSLHMSVNLAFHARTKHIELDYHFVQEKMALGTLITGLELSFNTEKLNSGRRARRSVSRPGASSNMKLRGIERQWNAEPQASCFEGNKGGKLLHNCYVAKTTCFLSFFILDDQKTGVWTLWRRGR